MPNDSQNFKDAKVLLGVTGGVAAYKAVILASKLTAAGAQVKTVMTESACELVGPKSFEAVTRSQVFTGLWETPKRQRTANHIELVRWTDIVVVAPATANVIGKIANGIADDLLSTLLCAACQKPVLLAPAMHNDMWENPAVQKNVATIIEVFGYETIGPAQGRLASGEKAVGRMVEPQEIMQALEKLLGK